MGDVHNRPANKHLLHSGMSSSTLRNWQTLQYDITSKNLMYPIFIIENDDAIEPIASMPGVSRFGVNQLKPHLDHLVQKGLNSVLLFGVISTLSKDERATNADSVENPVVRAIPLLKTWFPGLTIACDVCLCAYTSHGHCGILHPNGSIDNPASLARIAQVALSYVQAGADIVAPSDMMDGRIKAIKDLLIAHNVNRTVLSYAVKFASSFYGPFRDAANSKPSFGDRKCYQLPPAAQGLAMRAAARDVEEGADMLMVKPVMAYLDMVKSVKEAHPEYPLFVYQVSGEYSMILNAAERGIIDFKAGLTEILTAIRRAGADVIITYFTPVILDWLSVRSHL